MFSRNVPTKERHYFSFDNTGISILYRRRYEKNYRFGVFCREDFIANDPSSPEEWAINHQLKIGRIKQIYPTDHLTHYYKENKKLA